MNGNLNCSFLDTNNFSFCGVPDQEQYMRAIVLMSSQFNLESLAENIQDTNVVLLFCLTDWTDIAGTSWRLCKRVSH